MYKILKPFEKGLFTELIAFVLTQDQLKEMLDYDSNTGIFRWRNHPQKWKIGTIAGGVESKGYWYIYHKGKQLLAHRLAWLYVYGVYPKDMIDHIDRDRLNNKISNLRECNNAQNQRNVDVAKHNTSGYKGVTWNKKSRKWRAFAYLNCKEVHLGYFSEKDDAIKARNLFAQLKHGEFFRENN